MRVLRHGQCASQAGERTAQRVQGAHDQPPVLAKHVDRPAARVWAPRGRAPAAACAREAAPTQGKAHTANKARGHARRGGVAQLRGQRRVHLAREAHGALAARATRKRRVSAWRDARAPATVSATPDGVRERVVEAQRREDAEADGEKGERVAEEGGDEEQHDDDKVVDAVVVRCSARQHTFPRVCVRGARRAHVRRCRWRKRRPPRAASAHAPLHFSRDVHLFFVLGGVKRVKNSGRRADTTRGSDSAASTSLCFAAVRACLLAGVASGSSPPAGARGTAAGEHASALQRCRRGHVQTTGVAQRASLSATVSSCSVTLPQSMARAQPQLRAAPSAARCTLPGGPPQGGPR